MLDGQGVVRTLVNNVVDRTYLHGARGPEYERIGANDPVWYLYDGLGSVLGTVDKNGTVVSTRKYDVYGAVRGSTGPSGTKHKFVGNLGHPSEDETGLVYMRARYMDPVTGRFVSEDPAGVGKNWFNYANANPVNEVDRSGKSGERTQWVLNHIKSGGDYILGVTLAVASYTFSVQAAKHKSAELARAAIIAATASVIFFAFALGGTSAEIEAGLIAGAFTLAITMASVQETGELIKRADAMGIGTLGALVTLIGTYALMATAALILE